MMVKEGIGYIHIDKYAKENGIDAREIPGEYCFDIGDTRLVDVQASNDWMRESERDQSVALYRHFDSDGALLYVGISISAVSRLGEHKKSRWFKKISIVTIEWLPDREAACRAEIEAIKNEKPIYNKAHNNVGY